jgi:hypothetical protein
MGAAQSIIVYIPFLNSFLPMIIMALEAEA